MTDKPNPKPLNREHITEDVDPARMRVEMEGFFEHVLAHDPETLQFTAMLAGHEHNGGTHVCAMFSGPPPMLAKAVTEAMNELTNIDPMYAMAFMIHSLTLMKGMKAKGGPNVQVVGIGPSGFHEFLQDVTTDFDAVGGEDAAKAVADIMASAAKFSDPTPPSDDETKH